MSLFNCPHCLQPFGLMDLAEQEVMILENPIELGKKNIHIYCHNCLETFGVKRDVSVHFTTQEYPAVYE